MKRSFKIYVIKGVNITNLKNGFYEQKQREGIPVDRTRGYDTIEYIVGETGTALIVRRRVFRGIIFEVQGLVFVTKLQKRKRGIENGHIGHWRSGIYWQPHLC